MSFWALCDGETAKDTGKEYEVPGGNIEPIPDDTDVLAEIEKVEWNRKKDTFEEFVEITWLVLAPEQFARRKVFHKLWVTDFDPSAKSQEKAEQKRDKARRMLASIDANAGGSLSRNDGVPSSNELSMALQGKQMVVKCMVYSFIGNDGKDITGNWVAAVKPSSAGVTSAPKSLAKPKPQAPQTRDLDDEIPF